MAEGLLGDVFGGEEEGREQEPIEATVSAEAFASAVVALASRQDPQVARDTSVFLKKQTHLLELQAHLLEDEHQLRLSHLRGAKREGTIRRTGLVIRVAIQAVGALVLGAVGFGFFTLIHDAATSNSVVVAPFESPPALAARGLSSKVTAEAVADALKGLQNATRSSNKARSVVNAWSEEVKLEVPETGISVGEISRLLHDRFGHDMHIGGELVLTAHDGLSLIVRGDGVPAKSFEGAAGDFERLAEEAAGYIYGSVAPVDYAQYLLQAGKWDEATLFLRGAIAHAQTDAIRAALLDRWGIALAWAENGREAEKKLRLAMALAPGNFQYWHGLIAALEGIPGEGEEAAWQEAQAFLAAAAKAPEKMRPEPRFYFQAAQQLEDWSLAQWALQSDAEAHGAEGTFLFIEGDAMVNVQTELHDYAQSRHILALSNSERVATQVETLKVEIKHALDSDDPVSGLASSRQFFHLSQTNPEFRVFASNDVCLAGLILGLAGQIEEAEAVFHSVVPWTQCVAVRGTVLDRAGRGGEADKVWAEGLPIAPDLPNIYLQRGLAETRRGDFAKAESDLSTAHEKTPHWADPLKAWGDLLAKQGKGKDAAVKYDEALKYAPAWEALITARKEIRG